MRKIRKYKVGIEDLVVADFRTSGMTPPVRQWRLTNHVPYAKSCTRQIWFGGQQVFKTFPVDQIHDHSVTMYFGANAYQHLMRLSLGLLSNQFGETNIAGQLYSGWANIHKQYPEQAKPYDTLVQHLISDTRLIRHRIMPNWKMQTYELAARDLSGMQNQDSVLIIGHVNEQGRISPMTDMLVRKLTSNESLRAHEILITHPDPQVTKSLLKDLEDLKRSGRIRENIGSFNFKELPLAFELYDRAYITMPMGTDPEADSFIIDSWKNRSADGNTLTHLRSAAENKALPAGPWLIADLDNYTGPDEIREEMAARRRNNNQLAKNAEAAILKCVSLRLNQLQPSQKNLDNTPDAPQPSHG